MIGEAELALSEVITVALAIGHTQVASEAVSRRLFVRGVYQHRFDEAAVDQGYGAALVERCPRPARCAADGESVSTCTDAGGHCGRNQVDVQILIA